jgi:hypothetical protein
VYVRIHEDSEHAFNGTPLRLHSFGKPPQLHCLRCRTAAPPVASAISEGSFKSVARASRSVAAGPERPQCMDQYMRIARTAGRRTRGSRRAIDRSRNKEGPGRGRTRGL